MPLALLAGLELVVLTAGYWLIDLLLRQDGFVRAVRRAGLTRTSFAIGLWIAACVAIAPFWSWQQVPQGDALRVVAIVLGGMLAWKAATKDVDLVTGSPSTALRLLLVASVAASWASPAFLLAAGFLLTTPFALWEHHSTLPMRVVQVLIAYVCLASALAATALFGDAAVLLFFVVTILISHYLITALAKILLGPRWYSWVTDNRLHHLAASAYSWGWARFLPWSTWRKVIGALKTFEKPMQFATFGVELLAPLALLDPHLGIGFCLAWAAFHLGVFFVSGLLFWDWIVADLAIAGLIAALPPAVTERAFGPLPALVGLVFMLMFPLRHKLWKPMPLGWFDTPFTQRIHWRVRGVSGKQYGLYNDFMCPHERVYGKVHGCFLAPVPVVTYHLGEVWKPDLRDAIRAAGPDLERLEEVRRRFGIAPRNARMTAHHAAYLRRFFHELNRGARKHVLPHALRWLKAPGDQIYYWGELPPYRGQEQVAQVSLHYREEYFDGQVLRRLHDEQVLELDIDPNDVPEPVRELTPKEIDDYLLTLAAGRLIDLPGFRGRYTRADDGKPAPSTTARAEDHPS